MFVVLVTYVTDDGEAVPRSVQKPVKADKTNTVNEPLEVKIPKI